MTALPRFVETKNRLRHLSTEYAAELALRYYKEQQTMLREHKLSAKAFKCGPAENGRVWDALVAEFFGGRDLTPSCP